jgi:hypothetical protein
MVDLSYFNLGFRSDNVSNALASLKNKTVTNSYLLNDAFMIITDCLKIKDDNILFSGLSQTRGYEYNDLLPLVAELYSNENVDAIVQDLSKISDTVNKAREAKQGIDDTDIDHAISFFSRLSDLCLANSAHQTISEHHSLL